MKLRPMTMSDADFMLELKNYPETRQFAIVQHTMIDKEDHYKYLQENLDYFQTIVNVEKMIGAIRIKDYEVAIWVSKDFWNKGIATYILQHVALRGMTAKIVNANIASMKAFIRAGFEPVSYEAGGVVSWTDQHGETRLPSYYIFKKY